MSDRRLSFTVSEFCASVGIGRTKVYEELKAGRLRARKVGDRTLIPVDEAVSWLSRQPSYSPRERRRL